MITETGENLTVLINAFTADDWKAFASWYSIFKNLPDAKIAVVCNRNKTIEFQFFQWTKRLNIPHFYQSLEDKESLLLKIQGLHNAFNKKIIDGNILYIEAGVVITDLLDIKTINLLNSKDFDILIDKEICFLNNLNKDQINEIWNNYGLTGELGVRINNHEIYKEAKETEELSCISSFRKGCGKWIHTMKGCPFSSADGMVAETMTVNELRIIELWRKMVPLYSAVL